jgi:hypothetical protein
MTSSTSFGLLKSQIIYVESEYNDDVNNFLIENYKRIVSNIKKKNEAIDFVFIPQIFQDISQSGEQFEELVKYFFPYTSVAIRQSPKLDYFTTSFFTRLLFSQSDFTGEIKPGLVRLKKEKEPGSYQFEYYPFKLHTEISLTEQINHFISAVCIEDEQTADRNLPVPENENIIEKIKRDILEAKNIGFYELLLKEIGTLLNENSKNSFADFGKNKISRLTVDSDFRIILTDYNRLEIKMTPLPKALYILFLKHPEGIVLKQLPEYETELLEIYKLLSKRESFHTMVNSIKDMCSPALSGSVHEKLSRIREAFIKNIAEDYAKHYIISGDRGEMKRILIERKLVSLPEVFYS